MANGSPSEEASRLLEMIFSPPRDRRNIIRMAPVMINVCGAMKAMVTFYDRCAEVSEHLDGMLDLCRIIAAGGQSVPPAWAQQRVLSRGSYITEHPVYAALDHLSQRANVSSARITLMAHVILSIVSGLPHGSADSDENSVPATNILSACREIRLLSDSYMERFGGVAHDPRELYSHLENCIKTNPEGLPAAVLPRLRNLRRIIGLSLGHERPERRTRGPIGARMYVDVSWRQAMIDIDPDDGLHTDHVHVISALSHADEESVHDAVQDGLAAPDVLSSHTIQSLNVRYASKAGRSPEHGLYQQRGVANQIKRQAQLLPGRWEQLSELDRVSFLDWVRHEVTPVGLALLLSYMTGRSLDQIAETKIYHKSRHVPMSHSDRHISLCGESLTWISRPVLPERRRPMRASWQQNLSSPTENLVLPIPEAAKNLLSRYLGEPAGWSTGNVFTRAERHGLAGRAREALRNGIRREDTGLTVNRVERALFNALVSREGDIADAVLITGTSPPYGQATALFYYQVSVANLRSLYIDAIHRISQVQPRGSMTMEQLSMSDESVGSPFYPKGERLPRLVADLGAHVKQLRSMPPKAQSLADFHNSYTVYTAFLVAFATGYRSVKFPISRESDIDEASGFLVVADKVGDDMSHSRLVPLAPILRDHLRLYRTYREALIHRLWALHKRPAPEHFLFFLSRRTNRVTPITPSTLNYHSGWAYDLPLNLNRHFLRSELRARGITGELVNVFMGHWSQGQEPHGRFSSFDYRGYRDRLAPVLNRILADMGWEPLEGYL